MTRQFMFVGLLLLGGCMWAHAQTDGSGRIGQSVPMTVGQLLPQFGITECLIRYKCSVNTPPPHSIRSG